MQKVVQQQEALSQIPDAVKSVSVLHPILSPLSYQPYWQFIMHFHRAVLENNLAEITVAYESGWNKYTEKFYARTEWPEAELIAPLVNDGTSLSRIQGYNMTLFCQTLSSSFSTANSTTDTYIRVCSRTSMIDSIRTRTAANFSTTS